MISQETLERIKQNVRLVDVIGSHVSLTRRGTNFTGLCPFHSEKSPSFHVHENDNFYHCFGCGASGNVISWFMQFEGLGFPEAVRAIGERYGIDIKEEGTNRPRRKGPDSKPIYTLNTLAYKFFRHQLVQAPANVREYLSSRGLTEEAIEYFGVGFVPDEWRLLVEACRSREVSDELIVSSGLARRNSKGELYDTFRGRIIFPVWVDGHRIAGFGGRIIPGVSDDSHSAPKYINSPETPVYQKSSILYGLPQALATIRETRELVVVEGYMDVISLHMVGVTNAVATCGTALTADHVKRIKSLANNVLLLFDGDSAGRAAASRCFETFLNSGIEIKAVFLDAKSDPDTIAREKGEGTYAYLASCEQRPLIHCWLEYLAEKNGFSGLSELGAAAKGRLSEIAVQTLRAVENSVEQDELLRQASFLLHVNKVDLKALLDGVPERRAPLPLQTEAATEIEPVQSKPDVKKLRSVERELLYAIMAERRELPALVLGEPILIEELHPAVISFTQNLAEIVGSEELQPADKKEAIKELLKECGPGWIRHWKEAYQLQEDKSVDPGNVLRGCIDSLKRARVKKTLDAVEEQIRECADESMRAELIQQKIQLLKTIGRERAASAR